MAQMKKNLGGVVEECFEGAKTIDGSAMVFGKSRKDAAEMLVRKFGNNAEGVCSVPWKQEAGGGGHTFSWKITDGKVSFSDYDQGLDDILLAVNISNISTLMG